MLLNERLTIGKITLIVLAAFLSACAVPAQVAVPRPFTAAGISVSGIGLVVNNAGEVTAIKGVATNVSEYNFQMCTLTFGLFNSSGVKVSDAIATTVAFRSGQQWAFEAAISTPGVLFNSVQPGSIIAF